MGDIHDGNPLAFEVEKDFKELFDLGERQHHRRLVQHQNPGATGKTLADFCNLLVGHTEGAYHPRRGLCR